MEPPEVVLDKPKEIIQAVLEELEGVDKDVVLAQLVTVSFF